MKRTTKAPRARRDEAGREHAPLPPSASERWLACPPSMAYVEALIDARLIQRRVSGPSAQRGTRIHSWGEQFITWMLKGKKTGSVAGDRDELAEARAYADFCTREFAIARFVDPKATCGVEDRAEIDELCWGSRDFWILSARLLQIFDLKTGREPVSAGKNTQLIIYALDKFEALDLADAVDEVELVIWQPNSDDGGRPDRRATYAAREMRAWSKRIRAGVLQAGSYFGRPHASMAPDLRAGDHCSWCDALGVCPAAREKAQAFSKEGFEPVTPESKEIVQTSNIVDPRLLSAEQVGGVLKKAPFFVDWLEGVRTRALELMAKGEEVPGFKAVAKNTRFAWERALDAKAIAKALGLKPEQVQETRLLSPSKVRELVRDPKRKPLIQKMTWRPYAVGLAPEGDKRPAIPSTKLNFTPISREESEHGEE